MPPKSIVQSFMLRQARLLVEQTPVLAMALARWGPGSTAFLLNPDDVGDDEKAFLRQEVFCTHPPKGPASAVMRASWNVCAAAVGAPIFMVSAACSGVINDGVAGLLRGSARGLLWGSVFCGVGVVGAVQQLCWGAYNTFAGPIRVVLWGRRWDRLQCRFVPYCCKPSQVLLGSPSDSDLYEAAMRRQNRRSPWGQRASSGARGASHYDTLKVDRSATDKQIKEAFNRLALKLHPDRNPHPAARAEFEQVTKAYHVLSNPATRKKYDSGTLSEDAGTIGKRDAVRGLFGGDRLAALVGDVASGRFARRMIDGVYYLADELEVVTARQRLRSCEELLGYLHGFVAPSPTAGDNRAWDAKTAEAIRHLGSVGLGREVLRVAGTEYVRAAEYVEAPALVRAAHALRYDVALKFQHRWARFHSISLAKAAKRQDMPKMIDLAWGMCLTEIRSASRDVALTVLLDAGIDQQEKTRRLLGVKALGQAMLQHGTPYRGASAATVRDLQQSLSTYQRSKPQQP